MPEDARRQRSRLISRFHLAVFGLLILPWACGLAGMLAAAWSGTGHGAPAAGAAAPHQDPPADGALVLATSWLMLPGWIGAAVGAGLVTVLVSRRVTGAANGVVQVAQQWARGDLEPRLPTPPGNQLAPAAEGLNQAIGTVDRALSAIDEHAGLLASAAEELSAVSSELERRAVGAREQVEAVTAASRDVSGGISAIAASTEEVSGDIREIAESSTAAARIARTAVSAAGEARNRIERLNEGSVKIGRFVALIRGIAEKTHLLALNAAIEAARAGEAGRGFGVVAGEVKALAASSADASDEIVREIEAIQTVAEEVAAAIAATAGVIADIDRSLCEIEGAVASQREATEEIARRIASAATSSEEITAGAEAVQDVVGELTLITRETLAAGRDLAGMSGELRGSVSSLRGGASADA